MRVVAHQSLLAVVECKITELAYAGIKNGLSNDLVSHSAVSLIASTFAVFASKYS